MRLTDKNNFFEYILPCTNVVGDIQAHEIYLNINDFTCQKYIVGEAIKRFGELEDVLKKYGIESPKDLDNLLKEKNNDRTL